MKHTFIRSNYRNLKKATIALWPAILYPFIRTDGTNWRNFIRLH